MSIFINVQISESFGFCTVMLTGYTSTHLTGPFSFQVFLNDKKVPFKQIHVSDQNYSLTGENLGAIIFRNPKTSGKIRGFQLRQRIKSYHFAEKKHVLPLENKFTNVK